MSVARIALGRFGAVAIAMVCVQLDYFALALALPNMAKDLGTTPENLQWVVSGYMIATGIAMVPGSRLADLVGRKKVLLASLAVFGLTSLLCGLSPNPQLVIIARIAQGFAGGMLIPVGVALVSNATDRAQRPKVLGFVTGMAGVGMAAGPILGGGLSATIGWRWVFFVNVPLALLGVLLGWKQLKEQKDTELVGKRARNLDYFGIVLIALIVGGISLAIDNISSELASMSSTIVPAIVGIVALVGFAWWERRSRWPILPPELWRNQRFTALVIAASIANMGSVVMLYLATIFLQQTRGLSGVVAGLMFIPAAVGLALGGPISGRLAPLIPGQRVMTVAMLAGAVSLVGLAFTTNLVVYLIVMGIAALFLGMGFQFGTVAIQGVVKLAQAGAGAGTLLTVLLATGGMAVVAAAASLEKFGGLGVPSQHAMTITYLEWAAVVGVLGLIFGLWQWRSATLPSNAPESF